MPIEQRLSELGLELPEVPAPAANFGSLPFGITVEIEAIVEVEE